MRQHLPEFIKKPLRPLAKQVRRWQLSGQLQALERAGIPAAAAVARAIRKASAPADAQAGLALKKVEAAAAELTTRHEPLVDGTLGEPWALDVGKTVAQARGVSVHLEYGTLLYWLAREVAPAKSIELGTNVGVSSSYIATGLKAARADAILVTHDGSRYRQRVAQGLHGSLGLSGISYMAGMFTETFPKTLSSIGQIDFAFIDGDHTYDSTKHFYEKLRGISSEHAVLVFDDICWSDGMRAAWKELTRHPHTAISVDLERVGICIVSKSAVSTPQQFEFRLVS